MLLTDRRIELLALDDSTVLSTLSKGSICFAIDRATIGDAPFGMKLGSAPPDRCVVPAVADNADCICLFFEGWSPNRRLRSQFSIAKVGDIPGCSGYCCTDFGPICNSFADTRGVSPFRGGVCSGVAPMTVSS